MHKKQMQKLLAKFKQGGSASASDAGSPPQPASPKIARGKLSLFGRGRSSSPAARTPPRPEADAAGDAKAACSASTLAAARRDSASRMSDAAAQAPPAPTHFDRRQPPPVSSPSPVAPAAAAATASPPPAVEASTASAAGPQGRVLPPVPAVPNRGGRRNDFDVPLVDDDFAAHLGQHYGVGLETYCCGATPRTTPAALLPIRRYLMNSGDYGNDMMGKAGSGTEDDGNDTASCTPTTRGGGGAPQWEGELANASLGGGSIAPAPAVAAASAPPDACRFSSGGAQQRRQDGSEEEHRVRLSACGDDAASSARSSSSGSVNLNIDYPAEITLLGAAIGQGQFGEAPSLRAWHVQIKSCHAASSSCTEVRRHRQFRTSVQVLRACFPVSPSVPLQSILGM